MRAAVLREFGSPPAFEEWDEPVAADGAEAVEVLAAGINPVDLMIASGRFYGPTPPLPFVLGAEGVVRTADGRTAYVPKAASGTFAEQALVRPETLIDLPEGLGPGLAIAAGVAGLAAWGGLEIGAGLRSGESVLVLGASGVVGQIAVQVARLLGASRVVGAARSEEGIARLEALGVDRVVALDGGDGVAEAMVEAADGGFDVCLDLVYGPPLLAALGAMKPEGRVVQVGNAAAPEANLPAAALRAKNLSLIGYTGMRLTPEQLAATYGKIGTRLAAGEVEVEVEEVPLEDIAAAWARQAASPHRKLVVTP